MKILVTGALGFVGKNLISELQNRGYYEIFKCDTQTTLEELDKYTKECEFVFHLAGINRTKEEKNFFDGNVGFTSILLDKLKQNNNKCPILVSSSIQATLDNPYGKSKKECEELCITYSKENQVKVIIYRLTNLFGKWCKPNYNSVIATFCYNISRNIPIEIKNENIKLNFSYIDDVIKEFIQAMNGKAKIENNFGIINKQYTKTIKEIAEEIKGFKETRINKFIPNMKDEWTKKLYSTYLSYLPEDNFCYEIDKQEDYRGSFIELFKTEDRGQISINVINPKCIKGNHWHHTKNEKFIVIYGKGIIRLKKYNTSNIIEYNVSGEKYQVVDIPVGYVHQIENIGESEMIVLIWANEVFDLKNKDTYYKEV